MTIVNLEELSKMPNGTVFSRIIDPDFYNGMTGDMYIRGLDILCGKDKNSENYFNGVVHMLNYVSVAKNMNGNAKIEYDINCYDSVDTTKTDYNESDMFVVYDKTDIIEIINVLQWALTGCESELLTRSEFIDIESG